MYLNADVTHFTPYNTCCNILLIVSYDKRSHYLPKEHDRIRNASLIRITLQCINVSPNLHKDQLFWVNRLFDILSMNSCMVKQNVKKIVLIETTYFLI